MKRVFRAALPGAPYGTVKGMTTVVRFPAKHKRFRRVAAHPQFRHVRLPPAGYEFLTDERPAGVGFRDLLRTAMRVRDIVLHSGRGASLLTIAQFLRTRVLRSFGTGEPIFIPSFPFTIGTEPWFIEIEDLTTLFEPFVTNGRTSRIDVTTHDVFRIIKRLLEDPACQGILTHVQETKLGIDRLFGSTAISAKTQFIKIGYLPDSSASVPPEPTRQRPDHQALRFFFNNSWSQIPSNFYVRGGLFILNACERLHRDGIPFHLTIRSRMPAEIVKRFGSFLSGPAVTVLDRYMDWRQYSSVMASCHIYLIPSARIHVYSLLEAMYHGLAVVTSDGWGIGNYVTDGVTAVMVPGIYGLVSWQGANGQLCEDYAPMRRGDSAFEDNLYRALRGLIDDDERRLRLATAGQLFVRTDASIERFNAEFGPFLDRILANVAR
jgi:glycosyltransferase involved in cell wall biosynthesis